jgi:hypothetical protein
MTLQFPRIFRLRQRFEAPALAEPAVEVRRRLAELDLGREVRPGQTAAVAVGSRGIANLAEMVRAAVEHLKSIGLHPFIVPAMGSHGGGTAEGQRRVLESYGVSEQAAGCPIRSSVETVIVGRAAEGFPIHFDRLAFEADHVLVVNRVKPHTGFAGPIESGLLKMLLIGLGKHAGAKVYHRAIQDFSFQQIIRGAAAEVLGRCHILAGVAVVENALKQIARIEAVRPDEFERCDRRLLELSRRLMARLPFDRADVLMIDRIGKDISGTGMDPNVVGRKFDDHRARDDERPKIKRIAVRGLSPGSRGNALGIGMAEFCRSDILKEIDREATRLNVLTSGHVTAAMLPLDYPTDREMLAAALGAVGLVEPPDARLMWIADTLRLGEVECSIAYLDEARRRDDLEIITEPREMPFDAAGNLPWLESYCRT